MKLVKKILNTAGKVAKSALRVILASCALAIVGVSLLTPVVDRLSNQFNRKAVYAMLVYFPTERGLALAVAPKMVTNVHKKGDLLCYTQMSSQLESCVTFPMYQLTELKPVN